jgi:predicted RNase H-like HicB family nuclease
MEMKCTYEADGKFLVGHLEEYPEHPTQAFSVEELEENLKDIFALIQNGMAHNIPHLRDVSQGLYADGPVRDAFYRDTQVAQAGDYGFKRSAGQVDGIF